MGLFYLRDHHFRLGGPRHRLPSKGRRPVRDGTDGDFHRSRMVLHHDDEYRARLRAGTVGQQARRYPHRRLRREAGVLHARLVRHALQRGNGNRAALLQRGRADVPLRLLSARRIRHGGGGAFGNGCDLPALGLPPLGGLHDGGPGARLLRLQQGSAPLYPLDLLPRTRREDPRRGG